MGQDATLVLAELMRARLVALYLLSVPGDQHSPCTEHRVVVDGQHPKYTRIQRAHLPALFLLAAGQDGHSDASVPLYVTAGSPTPSHIATPLIAPAKSALAGYLVVERAPDHPFQTWEEGAIHRFAARLAEIVLRQADVTKSPGAADEQESGEEAVKAAAVSAWEALSLLAEASAVLTASLDYQETLDHVARIATRTLADWCTVIMLDDKGGLQRVAASHRDPAKAEQMQQLMEHYSPQIYGRSLLDQIIETSEPQVIHRVADAQIASWTSAQGFSELLRGIGTSSAMLVPLRARGVTLGVLSFFSSKPDRLYTADDLNLAIALAGCCALAIDNTLLYHAAQEAVAQRERFIAVASHELRTPLTHMLGFAHLLERSLRASGTASPTQIHYIERIIKGGQQLSTLSTDLLDLSQLRRGQLALQRDKVDVAALLREVVERARQHISPFHSLQLQGTSDPTYVMLDRRHFGRVIDNILDNAQKYSPAGGPIRLTLARQHGEVLIEVTDEGIGIPPESVGHIFAPFDRAPNATQLQVTGAGLGLYICRTIIEAHGGRIAAAPNPQGRGSLFSIWLPLEDHEERSTDR